MEVHHSIIVTKLVRDYCQSERNPKLDPFEIGDIRDRSDICESPLAERWGCYAIFNCQGDLRYIGMSKVAIGYRSCVHFAKAKASPFWLEGPATFVQLIAVTKKWEAPSLEAYLVTHTHEIRMGDKRPRRSMG